MRYLAVCFLLTGCGTGTFTYRTEQSKAEQLIWRDLYGMTADAPPVEWIASAKLDDGDAGITLIGWKIQIACGSWAQGDDGCGVPLRQTPYAHELMHWKSWLETSDVDASHRRADWNLVRVAEVYMGDEGFE